ncbi:relaxase domain-containing protein [Streptomyces sp. NPDC054786]
MVAAHFRHYEARSGMPLLHDHLLLSVKALRPDGTWPRCSQRPCTRTLWPHRRWTTKS